MSSSDKEMEQVSEISGDNDLQCVPLEKCFEELEQIVAALENESIPLEKSIELFERGMKLSRRCSNELGRIEKRIQIIVENAKGQPELKDFEES